MDAKNQNKQMTILENKKKLTKSEIGINFVNRQAVAIELAKLLADDTVLYIKTKNAYWNIAGEDFYDKHKFFETQFG